MDGNKLMGYVCGVFFEVIVGCSFYYLVLVDFRRVFFMIIVIYYESIKLV